MPPKNTPSCRTVHTFSGKVRFPRSYCTGGLLVFEHLCFFQCSLALVWNTTRPQKVQLSGLQTDGWRPTPVSQLRPPARLTTAAESSRWTAAGIFERWARSERPLCTHSSPTACARHRVYDTPVDLRRGGLFPAKSFTGIRLSVLFNGCCMDLLCLLKCSTGKRPRAWMDGWLSTRLWLISCPALRRKTGLPQKNAPWPGGGETFKAACVSGACWQSVSV